MYCLYIYRTFKNGSEFNVTFTYDGSISFLEHVVVKTTLYPTFPSDEDEENSFQLIQDYDGGDLFDFLYFISHTTAPKRGDIQVEMLSPMGTLSILLPYRYSDITPTKSMYTPFSAFNDSQVFKRLPQILIDDFIGDGYIDWPFMSVHYWGEDPRGEWTLTFRYQGDYHLGAFEDLLHYMAQMRYQKQSEILQSAIICVKEDVLDQAAQSSVTAVLRVPFVMQKHWSALMSVHLDLKN